MNKFMYAGRISWGIAASFLLFMACNIASVKPPAETDVVEQPEKFAISVKDNLSKTLSFILDNKGRLNDSVLLANDSLVYSLYEKGDFQPQWCSERHWLPLSDSLFSFIAQSKQYGLFPSDYHFRSLSSIRSIIATDSLAGKDAALWSRADVMMSDAFFQLARHLKRGRLPFDSVTLRTDTIIPNTFYEETWNQLLQSKDVTGTLHALEPKHARYDSLKMGLKFFLDSIPAFKRYTYITYPNKDSATLYNALQRRLFEGDIIASATQSMDTAAWRATLAGYQQSQGLKVTGKINENTVKSLNNTDWEKFKRIAITLDRFKLLTDTLPHTYVWVNLPAYTMQVINDDTLALESKVIVGQSRTRTPLLTSNITNFIVYPQWTVPYSIIFKEMLPQIKRNVDYLRRQNLMVVDKNDSIVDPHTIDWNKYTKSYFPFLLKQRQGDDNSLGVLKFNFANKYSVYLHDTNARWLFSQKSRALSHGCVRVKEFLKLADFLVRDDSVRYHPDTLRHWIARQEKHTVYGFPRVPIYIRYFSCEGKEGKLRIYDDIYAEDKLLRDRYFADKPIL